jgi:hypothetical protein
MTVARSVTTFVRSAWLAPLCLLLLAACTTTDEASAPMPAPPQECPKDLAYLQSSLVTPYDKLDAFMGPGVLEKTLHKPIDESIEHGGGIDRSIQSVSEQVQELKNELANADQIRADDKKAGQSDEWIDTYLSATKDGVTINQGFLDAVKCRKARLEQTESVPAS